MLAGMSEPQVTRLDNGFTVLTVPGGTGSASSMLFVGAGSRYEHREVAGTAHFLEHLFFKGTQRRPTSKEIADAIEGVGGFINASTDKELTAYWTRVPAEHLQLGLDVLARSRMSLLTEQTTEEVNDPMTPQAISA